MIVLAFFANKSIIYYKINNRKLSSNMIIGIRNIYINCKRYNNK
jgi:hypothetical protein